MTPPLPGEERACRIEGDDSGFDWSGEILWHNLKMPEDVEGLFSADSGVRKR